MSVPLALHTGGAPGASSGGRPGPCPRRKRYARQTRPRPKNAGAQAEAVFRRDHRWLCLLSSTLLLLAPSPPGRGLAVPQGLSRAARPKRREYAARREWPLGKGGSRRPITNGARPCVLQARRGGPTEPRFSRQQCRGQRLLRCGGRHQLQRHGPVLGATAPRGRLPHLPGEWPRPRPPARARPPGWPGPFEPPSLSGGTVSPERRVCASSRSEYLLGPWSRAESADRVAKTMAPERPGDQSSVTWGLEWASGSAPAPGQ